MMNRIFKYILFIFFIVLVIDLRFIAWAEEASAQGKIARIEQKFVASAEKITTEEIIPRPVMEYGSDSLRDPFKKYLVKDEPKEISQENAGETEPKLDLDKFKVQGIIWGVKTPQAIINNNVFKIGDLIEGAEILSIEKQGVTLRFNGRIFDLVVPRQNSVPDENPVPDEVK